MRKGHTDDHRPIHSALQNVCRKASGLLPQDSQIYAFTRCLEDIELLVLANFSHEIVEADLLNADDWAASEVLLTNYSQTGSEEILRLRPWEARVFRRTVRGDTPKGGDPHSCC